MDPTVMQTYFLATVLGLPVLMLTIALLAGYLHRSDANYQSAWSTQDTIDAQARDEQHEITQLLAAQNELRRRRGASQRTLQDITKELAAAPKKRAPAGASQSQECM